MAVRRLRTTFSLMAMLALGVGTLTACSGKSASVPKHTLSTAAVSSAGDESAALGGTSPAGGSSSTGSAPAQKPSNVNMRVVNLYAPIGASGPPTAGPALDVYDIQLTGQAATPIATNIAYGSASPYFVPDVPSNSYGHPAVQLYALPAGEDPKTKYADAKGIGGAYDDGSHAQITWVLTADNGGLALGGPLGRLSFSNRVEKGDDGNGGKAPVAPAPASGRGEILVDASALSDRTSSFYLLIDHSCAPPINGDPNAKGLPEIFNAAISGINTSFAIFATTPGRHQVSVVNISSGTQPTCAQLTAKQGTVSVDVSAGQQLETYVYGTSVTDLHLALAPLRA